MIVLSMASEEPILRYNVSDFNDNDQQHDFHEHGEPSNQKYSNPYQNRGGASTNDLYEGLTFESKQAAMNSIKQFHFMNSFNFNVVDNKSDKYVVMCSQYGNGCYWRARVSFNKIRKRHATTEQSYNYLLVWLTTAQHFVPYTIVKYKTSSSMEDGEDESPRMILNRVFWAFNPCIEGFKYCKPIVQRYVTPLPNLCIISDRGIDLLAVLQSERIRWNGPNVSSVYCIKFQQTV
ncbi:hypothetical protein HKD37_10G028254 [Glycine soja]